MEFARVEENVSMVIYCGAHSFDLDRHSAAPRVDSYTFVSSDAAASWAF